MRSERNPYFLLKRSRDPRVQHYLAMAVTASHDEIEALEIKKDLKRAMHFVRRFGKDAANQTAANLIADRAQVCTPTCQQYPIYHYQGTTVALNLPRGNSLLSDDFLFLLDHNRIFAQHNWIDLDRQGNEKVLLSSKRVGFGDQHQYNRMIQDHLSKKYGHTTHDKTQSTF